MALRRSFATSPPEMARVFGLGLLAASRFTLAQTPGPPNAAPASDPALSAVAAPNAGQPAPPVSGGPPAAPPLTGYIVDISGASVRLSFKEADGVRPGDEFSVLEYGEEIARLKVRVVTAREALADIVSQKGDTPVRRLDTVVPSTTVQHPASRLEPPPPNSSARPLRPTGERRRRHRQNDGEIVSRADWAYPALSTLAEHRLIPIPLREFHGDQQFTRAEIRGFISEALAAILHPTDEEQSHLASDSRLLYHLAKSFDVQTDLPDPARGVAFDHVHRYRAATGPEPALSSSSVLQGFAHLGQETSAVVSLGRGRQEWYGNHRYPWLNEAFLQSRWLGVDWTVGQRTLRWGPGYTGSFVLGDVMPTLPVVRMQKGWSLGRLGYWNLDQFVARYTEADGPRYLMGRRVTHPLNSRWALGMSETLVGLSKPNPTALVLPFLAYKRIFYGLAGTNHNNAQEDADLHYTSGRNEGYGELFIDDITAPFGLGSQGKVPRKIGYLFGWRRQALFGQKGTDLRVEYAATDRNTTLNRNPSVSLYDRGFPIGHPMGPNAQSFLVRADRRMTPKLELTGAVQLLTHNHPGPPASPAGTAFTLAAAYDFRSDRSLTLKVSPGRRVDRYDLSDRGSVEMVADWVF